MKFTKFFALLCAVAGVAACTPAEEPGNEPQPEVKGNLTLTADKTQIEIGESVTFTVTLKDEAGVETDVTADAKFYDQDLEPVSNPFTPVVSGGYTINAIYSNLSSNNEVITVMAQMPEVPEDPQLTNTKFNHRVLLVDNTGVGCGYCPAVVDVLLALEQTDYHDYYTEVTCHAGYYAAGDPARSNAAEIVNSFYNPTGYPDVRLNFYSARFEQRSVSYYKSMIDNYRKADGADVGISMAVAGDSAFTYCAAQIKANVAQEYKVVAWLLESGIYSPNQAGATKPEHRIYDYALRNIYGDHSKANISGSSIGVLKAGETHDCSFQIPIINTNWNWENMGVLVIVSAKDAQGRWEVANSAYCALGEGGVAASKTYEYIE